MKHDRGYSGMCLYCGAENVEPADDCPARANEKAPRAIVFHPTAAQPEQITIHSTPVGSAQQSIDPIGVWAKMFDRYQRA